jgi:NitT/TauT family transport system substrate-binding protein
MKSNKISLAIMALGALTALASCGTTTTSSQPTSASADYGTINIGLQGNYGASAGFVGISKGYFKSEGLTPTSQILSGPNIIVGLQTGTLDVGFLGNGVAWNYFLKKDAPIKLLTIDNLTNDDRMIASSTGAGKNLSEKSTNEEVYTALKGAKVALAYDKTPGTFFQSLVGVLNEGKAAADQIWYKVPGTTDIYPAAAAQTAGFEITLQSMDNGSVTAAMTGSTAPDFCVTFSPVSTALTTLGLKVVATTLGRLGDTKLTPSTWAVSTAYLAKNPDAVKAFLRGLMKSFDLRHSNPTEAGTITADANKFDGTYDTNIAYWPSSADIKGYFETETGKGMQYVEQIRASQLSKSQLADGALESKDVIVDRTWIVDACKAVAA